MKITIFSELIIFLENEELFVDTIKLVTISSEAYTISILEYLLKKEIYNIEITCYQ
jgi:hypothetical protein